MTPRVIVYPDAEQLAAAVADRLLTRLAEAIAARGRAHVVLTGGGIGIGTLAAVAKSEARHTVDWQLVDIWWGDERFLPEGDPERNETQARNALLDQLRLTAERVHPMAPSDGPDGEDPDAAAARYAAELTAAADSSAGVTVPQFDVLMLGIGPDGHVASLFPGHPALQERARTTIGVRQSPKPPPTRISLTFPALNAAREIWLIAAGEGKAEAVANALNPGGPPGDEEPLPAARVHGTSETRWLLDRAASHLVPEGPTSSG